METKEVDYSEDTQPDRVIFRLPCFSSMAGGPSLSLGPELLISLPVVTLSEHCSAPPFSGFFSLKSPALDIPPLSPGTLHILTANMPSSPSFNPHSSFFAATFAGIPPSVAPNPSVQHSPLGCFETLVIKVKPANPFHWKVPSTL